MYLDAEMFRNVVARTPLVSIDLIVRNRWNEVLLGLRNNRPAKGFWFVPGGRIMKGERLDESFRRLSEVEIGVACERCESRFLGLFEHHYEDSVFGSRPSTHYVVLAHELRLNIGLEQFPEGQHSLYRWWSFEEGIRSEGIHPYTRTYISQFLCGKGE